MTATPTLFDASPADVLAPHRGAVRATHPATSHLAAAKVAPRIGGQKRDCLLALYAAGDRGLTAHECCELTSCAYPHVASTRIASLVKLALAEPTGGTRLTPSACEARVYRVTLAGRSVAAELTS